MQIQSILDDQVALTLFDLWLDSVHNRQRCRKGGIESPLIDAAFQAFNHYVALKEVEHNALIATVGATLGLPCSCAPGAAYGPNPQNTAAITTQDIAPFLALNLMA